jgi:UPF0716 protein FxsA
VTTRALESRPRRSRLTPLLVVALVAVPIFEVWLLIQVGQWIGGWQTLLILVAEAILGAWLMRREGGRAWKELNTALASGKMPSTELADAALVLVGGLLLMLPGFATDLVGFFFLLPFTRPLARRLLAFFVARRLLRLGVPPMTPNRSGVVIEGETVEPQENRPGAQPSDPLVISGEIDDGRP